MTEQPQGVIWSLDSFFPAFGGPEMKRFKEKLVEDAAAMQEKAAALAPLSAETADAWETLLLASEDYGTRAIHLSAYVGCLNAADAANEDYTREKAALARIMAEYQKFEVDVLRAFQGVEDEVFEAFLSRERLAGMEHALRRMRKKARHRMPEEQEKLATDLGVDGFHAWSRLYNTVTGKLTFDMEWPDGTTERLPIARWRALMSHPDREIGRRAFEGGNRAFEGIEDVCAAALNAIAGTRLTLYRHRGIDHFLDDALFAAAIEPETLDALNQAIDEHAEIGREIFRTKARAMGREGIRWFEREAPIPVEDHTEISWERGVSMVESAFGSVYPKLADYYRSMLDRGWIESQSRPGKLPGAFCTGSPLTREQRVYMTYNGTLGDVRTMAHEVGHAFHGHVLTDLRPVARMYPMTLAETASIFGEHLLAEGIRADSSIGDAQKLLMLDAELGGAATMLLDITTRFRFEKRFYEERDRGEVPVSRLRELMATTQREVFGDALIEGGEDPLFWASKLHFYITGVSFYNFPYTFGFLLARALFGLVKEQGPEFLPRYEEFLRLTGSDTVENVVRRSIGADVRDPAFWAKSIRTLEEPLARYRELT